MGTLIVSFLLAGAAMLGNVQGMLTVDGSKLLVQTASLRAQFDGAALTSLRPADDEVEFVHPTPPTVPIDLYYVGGATFGRDKHERCSVRKISDLAARIVVAGEDTERALLVRIDPATGDLCITPDGLSNRRALISVRWVVAVHPEAELILPVVNGLVVRSDRPWPPGGRFRWPFQWNAQLVIAQRGGYACMIHSQDRAMRFKTLNVHRDGARTELGFESEAPGPVWDNRTAGGIEWRISLARGDWKTPAARYRAWMQQAYDLAGKRAHRPAWVDQITLAVCWADAKLEMLDALAAVHPPSQTLIHLSTWRTDKYDINYPDYTPSERALAYLAKANEMGFHVMPHFNYWAVHEKHPFFQKVRDFQIRSLDRNAPEGWYWPPETHDYTRLAYIHPGLGLWRRRLVDAVLEACGRVRASAAFLDQTLCTWNTDNAFVGGLTTVTGLVQLQEELAAVRPGLVLAGEGLNEVSFQRQCFAQAHIHQGWEKLEPKHLQAAHPICSFLWAGHTRLIGYHHINPDEPDVELGVQIYERLGAIPTIVTNNPARLRQMSAVTRRIFEAAKAGQSPE